MHSRHVRIAVAASCLMCMTACKLARNEWHAKQHAATTNVPTGFLDCRALVAVNTRNQAVLGPKSPTPALERVRHACN